MKNINASLEVSPKHVFDNKQLNGLLPQETDIYIADIGTDSTEDIVKAAKILNEYGYCPVPHLAARRLSSSEMLSDRVERLAKEANVKNALVIAGDIHKALGPYEDSLSLLQTEIFDRLNFNTIAIAGHPEGSPNFTKEQALDALKQKQIYAQNSDIEFHIVTQFGFDMESFIAWSEAVKSENIDFPIHLGVAGPAKIATLIRFAALCGVGNSLAFLKKRGSAVANLATGYNPNSLVEKLENYLDNNPESNISQIHVFPFGGIEKTAQWLKSRGSL